MHQMHLHDLPFTQIKTGIKTTEIRLNDPKRQALKVGDIIEFIHYQTNQTLQAEITKITHAANLKKLYQITDPIKAGWEQGITEDEYISYMTQFYPQEEKKEYGVVEITLELI